MDASENPKKSRNFREELYRAIHNRSVPDLIVLGFVLGDILKAQNISMCYKRRVRLDTLLDSIIKTIAVYKKRKRESTYKFLERKMFELLKRDNKNKDTDIVISLNTTRK